MLSVTGKNQRLLRRRYHNFHTHRLHGVFAVGRRPCCRPENREYTFNAYLHTLTFARSLIFGNDSVLSVKIPENTSDKIRISCDGDDSVELRPGDCVRVGKSKYYADFIRIKNESFIDVLNSKLAQRRA